MAHDKDFADKLAKLMQEQLAYGTQLTPVQQASWPSEIAQPKDNTAQTTVTNGETTPLGAPRSDLAAQDGCPDSVNSEAMGEIASLLISIGYILSKEGVLPDKFNMQGAVKFLNDKFGSVTPPITQDAPPEEVEVSATEVQAPVDAVPQEQVAQDAGLTYENLKPYMEARKLLESRFASKKNK